MCASNCDDISSYQQAIIPIIMMKHALVSKPTNEVHLQHSSMLSNAHNGPASLGCRERLVSACTIGSSLGKGVGNQHTLRRLVIWEHILYVNALHVVNSTTVIGLNTTVTKLNTTVTKLNTTVFQLITTVI